MGKQKQHIPTLKSINLELKNDKKKNNNAEIIDKIIKEGREKAKGDMNGVLIKVNE